MALPSILLDACTFFALVLGLGFLWLPWLRGDALERLTLVAAAGLAQLYALSWTMYLLHLPRAGWYLLPLLALGTIGWRWAAIRDLVTSAEGRRAALQLGLFAGWCLGWLCLIRSYGGGEWSGDWYEHYERDLFFLGHQPADTRFSTGYGVTSRPPLANLVIGAFLALRGTGFPHAQVFTTLFSSLVLLPALLLCRRFAGGSARGPVLLVLLMANPFVLQNATFAWTKLPCAFFVLAALAVYLQGRDPDDRARRSVAFGLMTLGVLTHYSAAPYLIALFVLHAGWSWSRNRPASIRELCQHGALAAGLFATWLGWAWWQYGARAAWLDNSTVTAEAGLGLSTQLLHRLQTAWATLVPHALRPVDYAPIQQLNAAGFLRDYLFNIYQTTWVGALGLSGVVLAVAALRMRKERHELTPDRRFWGWLALVVTVLGIATYAGADRWGIAHITFGPLVIGALAWLAGRAPLGDDVPAPGNGQPANHAGRPAVRWLWPAALGVDALLGIVLQFYFQWAAVVQAEDVRAFLEGQSAPFSPTVIRNAVCKAVTGTTFVADGGPPAFLVAPLLVVLALAAFRALAWTRVSHPAT